jgi:heat shock protein HtpX
MTKFVNNVKTAVFLGLLFGLILLAGQLLGGTRGLLMALILGGAMNVFVFLFSDKLALASMGGQRVDEQTAPDLIQMVSRLADNAGLPMPKVYVCPQEAPNAFATGRSPRHAAVAVTRGALKLLSYDELEGVIGHELAHVKNRDTLISTVAATVAGALNYLGWMFMFSGGERDRAVHPLAGVLLVLLAPIAALLVQMAISRSREFVADADGAAIVGTPAGLISALRKLDAVAKRIPMENEMPAQNHMFIVAPLTGASMARLFSTHPPTEARIRKLQELA